MTSTHISSSNPLTTAKTWMWRGFPIHYQAQGEQGPAIVLVHGFGASWGHWRKNIPVLAQIGRVYAIDLIGFGASAKPKPGNGIEYTFETWGQQLADFCREVVGTPVLFIGNSIGCIAVMQAVVDHPDLAIAIALINCSLRLLHDRHRHELPWYRNVGTTVLQKLLKIRVFGHNFFRLIARPQTIRKILLKAYIHSEAVTDELVEMLMAATADPGAPDVFIAFTGYSQGPLPEDLLAVLPCPATLLWGTEDPWEPFALGQKLAEFPVVQDFISIVGAGHCPQDEVPELVNPILQQWIERSISS